MNTPASVGARHIQSRDNPLLQRVRKLLHDPMAYRKLGQCWLEGEHLALALQARGGRAAHALFSESAWSRLSPTPLATLADDVVVVPDALMAGAGGLASPAGVGLLLAVPPSAAVLPAVATVVLDRLQDAGNVGSILRSAAALGVRQVIALKGTAGLWSPKVLRAGMGAQLALQLVEGCEAAALDALQLPLLATSSHAAAELQQAHWVDPCAWVFGHEGQGVCAELMQRCTLTVRIPQPGGEESLNVAAAAAICLYEAMRRR
jgi:RNA methyltransferase, TrmH family